MTSALARRAMWLFACSAVAGVTACSDDATDKPIDTTQFIPRPIRHQSYQGIIASAEQLPTEIHGPFTEFVAPGKVRIEWDTAVPMSSELRFGIDMESAREFSDKKPKTEHAFVVDQVQPEVVYRFRVGGQTDR